jgi:hypothetical protein
MRLKYGKVIFVKLSLSKDYVICDPHLSKKKKKTLTRTTPILGGAIRDLLLEKMKTMVDSRVKGG